MIYDREGMTISTAGSRTSRLWPSQTISWSEMAERLRTPMRGSETYEAYMRLPKAQRDALKDVGGYVGGRLRNGRRSGTSVMGRDIVTLDLDSIPSGMTETVLDEVGYLCVAAAVYSTRKHCAEHPRLRVVIPMDRTVTPEEYEPIARRIGEYLGIERCDPSTFESCRMMYWPSVCADGEYVYEAYDAPIASADKLLATYQDWHIVASWPQIPGATTRREASVRKQEDPTAKTGIVGAFCRCYDVYRVMDELLPETYIPADIHAGARPTRYTYTGGSTTGGAIVYGDGKWLYSHHGTDPAGGQLCNAFDLARLHLYGDRDLDEAPGTPVCKKVSYLAMIERAKEDPAVKLDMLRSRAQSIELDFGDTDDEHDEDPADDSWQLELELDANGHPKKTTNNAVLIMRHDPLIRGRVAYDAFAGQLKARGRMPWDTLDTASDSRPWTDGDDAGLRWYLETYYGLTNISKVADAVAIISMENKYDEVAEYLGRLEWDGVPRVDTLLIRYLKADDNAYTRAVTRKALTAAVTRALEPGTKFDTVLTLVGAQGIGKSLFGDILGGQFYTDNVQTFEGKDAAEQLRNAWIVEIPEVDRFSHAEASVAKQFITRRDDIYREAYGRRTTSHPRRCIFVATVNPDTFLNDDSGNRRWWVVKCHATKMSLGASMDDLRAERDQIWAEAKMLWATGESLRLNREEEEMASQAQEDARIKDPWQGLVEEFVSRKVPEDWRTRPLDQRRIFWGSDFQSPDPGTLTERREICAVEVWCEAFGKDRGQFKQADARRINACLARMEGWIAGAHLRTIYGRQYGYRRDILAGGTTCQSENDAENRPKSTLHY